MFEDNGLNVKINKISSKLLIKLDEEPFTRGNMYNLYAKSTSKIVSLKFTELSFWDENDEDDEEDDDDFKVLNELELNEIGFNKEKIVIHDFAYKNENGHFTIKELFEVILETEKEVRAKSIWFGGIDVHHIYFEGLEECADGSFEILWGS